MNVNNALSSRSLGLSKRVDVDFIVSRIRLKDVTELDKPEDQTMRTQGPLACARLANNVLAIANEDGYINLLRCDKMLNGSTWLAHNNAIFDIKSCPDQKTFISASGDATLKIWNAENQSEIRSIKAHDSSIKSVSVYDDNTIASGSRDGTIKVHDLRSQSSPVLVIRDAHRNVSISKRRRVKARTDPVSCVTNVVFDPVSPRLYSTGANDATIKLWDMRKYRALIKPRRTADGQLILNHPNAEIHHPTSGMHCGYSHLLISSGRIFAACSDNKIYSYENFDPNSRPTIFHGYNYDTYLKLSVMDDRFLISGAKRGGALIWSLADTGTTKRPIGQLSTDNSDEYDTNVIEADWRTLSIFTFRDDRLVHKWTI